MDKTTLNLYYRYFIPITILQLLTSIFLMTFLSVEDYGIFMLYLSAINFFFFLTLGIQNGYTIYIKENSISKNINSKFSLNLLILISAITIFSLPILGILNIEFYWKLAFLCGLSNVIFIVHKSIYRVDFQIHHLNILILCYRLIFLIDIINYIIFKDISFILLGDVVLRFILVIISTVILFNKYKNISIDKLPLNTYAHIIKIGLPLMIGNWLVTMYTILDKTLLNNMPNELGLYSFAITSVLLIRVLLTPIGEMYFVTLNKNESLDVYYKKLNLIFYFGSVFVLISSIGAYFLIDVFGILSKYSNALPSLLILLNIIPLSTSLDIHTYNFVRRYNGKLFVKLAALCSILTYSVLYIYINYFTFDLIVYSYVVYFTYLLVFLTFNSIKLSPRTLFILGLKYIIFMFIYSVFIFNML